MKIAVIFGGSGFIGQSLIRKLLDQNFRVKVVTRDKEKAAFLKTYAGPDFLQLIEWNYRDFDRLDQLICNASLVVNLIGLLAERKKGDFKKFHVEFPQAIALKCNELNIANFVHISALGIDKTAKSKYAISKLEGEKAIIESCSDATILRPSIIFGPADNFFNKFGKMAKKCKILPLINDGQTKFQPIYVEDLSEIISKIPCHKKTKNKIFEIGGDKIYSFKKLMELTSSYCNQKVIFINLPFVVAKFMAIFLEVFSKEILTCDQVEMLKINNVVTENNFRTDFKINPKSVEEIVPNYLR